MKKPTLPMGELALIDQIRRASGRKTAALALGIGDDCAILRPPFGSEVLVTTDFTLEDRHFRRDLHPAESVGHRCLARGLSDLAAMGATPLAAFLSLALPSELLATKSGQIWVERFFSGLRALGDRYGVPLAGGDTAASPAGLILADIVLVGAAPVGKSLRRSGASPEDALYCTGRLGGAAAELAVMFAKGRMARATIAFAQPQLFPEPRIRVGAALLRRGLATACLDISDGLSTDLTHLCVESGVDAEIDVANLPIHPLASKLGSEAGLKMALHGGEDYELLFSAPATQKIPRRIAGVEVTRIGRLSKRRRGRSRVTLIEPDGSRSPLEAGGWEHFSPASTR